MRPTQQLFRTLTLLGFWAGPVFANECTVISGVVTYPSTDYCQTSADYYAITLYEIGLCAAAPTGPSNTSALDTSACEVVWLNSSGTVIEVESGTSTTLPSSGLQSKPADGVYSFGYARLSNAFTVGVSLQFATSLTGGSSGSGVYCATMAGTATRDSTAPTTNSSTCGATAVTAGRLIDPLTDFSGGGAFENTANETTTYGELTAYLTGSSDYLAGSAAAVTGISAVQEFLTPVVITPDSTTFDLGFEVSQGISITDYDNAGLIDFGNGPFSIRMTVY